MRVPRKQEDNGAVGTAGCKFHARDGVLGVLRPTFFESVPGACTGDAGWLGLGPVVFCLVLLHVAALLFWVVALVRSSLSPAAAKAAQHKQH